MGRDLNWYVIPRNIEHDKTKELCLDYEFQGDEEDVKCELFEKVTNESALFDYSRLDGEDRSKYFKIKKEFEDKISDISYHYKYDEEHKIKWCPKCHMFATGLYDTLALVDTMHIGHSYSSLYWWSKWNIKDMYIGSSNTEFTNLFRNDIMYREITHNDVVSAINEIEELGTPLRNSDIEACQETMDVLNFLAKWTKDDNYRVIMEDEV